MDKVSAYREFATVFLDMPELIAVRRLARTIATITEHAPREYVLATRGGKENPAVRYIVKMIAAVTEYAKREELVSATKTLLVKPAVSRPVRWQTTKYVVETDDVWMEHVYATMDTKVPIVL